MEYHISMEYHFAQIQVQVRHEMISILIGKSRKGVLCCFRHHPVKSGRLLPCAMYLVPCALCLSYELNWSRIGARGARGGWRQFWGVGLCLSNVHKAAWHRVVLISYPSNWPPFSEGLKHLFHPTAMIEREGNTILLAPRTDYRNTRSRAPTWRFRCFLFVWICVGHCRRVLTRPLWSTLPTMSTDCYIGPCHVPLNNYSYSHTVDSKNVPIPTIVKPWISPWLTFELSYWFSVIISVMQFYFMCVILPKCIWISTIIITHLLWTI